MVDKPEANAEGKKPKEEEPSTPDVAETSTRVTPRSAGDSQTQAPKQPINYRENIMGPFIAIWRLAKGTFGFVDRHHGSISAFATVAIVALTYFYVHYSKQQWKTMREALVSVQRAFVTFSPNGSIGTWVENGRVISWTPQVPIANRGTTTAKQMTTNASFYASATELPEAFTFPDIGSPRPDVLGPQDTHTVTAGPIPIKDIQAVQQHMGHVYVYGWAKYKDVFMNTKTHLTQFCYELFLNTIPGDVTDPNYFLSARFNLCAQHNCTDDDCKQ